jgi:hypothetical protein
MCALLKFSAKRCRRIRATGSGAAGTVLADGCRAEVWCDVIDAAEQNEGDWKRGVMITRLLEDASAEKMSAFAHPAGRVRHKVRFDRC